MIARLAAAGSSESSASFGTGQVVQILFVLFLVVFSGLLAAAETALTRMTKIRASSLAEDDRRGAKAVVRIVEAPEKFISPLLLIVLFSHLTMSTIVGLLVEPVFGAWGVIVAIALELAVIFIFSELGPKNYALKNTDKVSLALAPFVLSLTGFPPIRLLTRGLVGIGNIVLPGRINDAPMTTEHELLAFADAALDDDVIERDEREMIHSIVEFGDTIVREVMKPRTDMITVSADKSIEDVMDVAISAGYSRIPVIRESKDDIAGVVYAKDLMRALRDGKPDAPVVSIVRPARFCPESKRVSELMREMQNQKFHLCVVLDEYGGTAGLVTLEDLIEELVGEIVDEYDVEEAQVLKLPNGDHIVTATMLIDELNELLGVEWPSEDWDSVGGLLFNQLGHVPHEGETVSYEHHLLRAERVKGRRIGRVRITHVGNLHDAAAALDIEQ